MDDDKIAREQELIRSLSEPLSPQVQQRFDELIAKRIARSLSDAEYQELLTLTDVIENCDAERISQIAELSELRSVTLQEVLAEFGQQREWSDFEG